MTTLQHDGNATLTTNDFRDDRLATLLRFLSDDAAWSGLEAELTERTIRVYDLARWLVLQRTDR